MADFLMTPARLIAAKPVVTIPQDLDQKTPATPDVTEIHMNHQVHQGVHVHDWKHRKENNEEISKLSRNK